MYQIIGLRYDPQRKTIKHKYYQIYARGYRELVTARPDLVKQLEETEGVGEDYNLFFTASQATINDRNDFQSQEIITFDLDKLDTDRYTLEDYLDVWTGVVGIAWKKCWCVATGNGLQIHVRVREFDEEYIKTYKPAYNAICKALDSAMSSVDMSCKADTTVFCKTQLLRLPGTWNRKPIDKPFAAGANVKKATTICKNIDIYPFKWDKWQALSLAKKKKIFPLGGSWTFKPHDINYIFENCDFLAKQLREGGAHADYNEWYSALGVTSWFQTEVGKYVETFNHLVSNKYPGYDSNKVDAKVQECLRSTGPRTCDAIDSIWTGCSSCKKYNQRHKFGTPLNLRPYSQEASQEALAEFEAMEREAGFENLAIPLQERESSKDTKNEGENNGARERNSLIKQNPTRCFDRNESNGESEIGDGGGHPQLKKGEPGIEGEDKGNSCGAQEESARVLANAEQRAQKTEKTTHIAPDEFEDDSSDTVVTQTMEELVDESEMDIATLAKGKNDDDCNGTARCDSGRNERSEHEDCKESLGEGEPGVEGSKCSSKGAERHPEAGDQGSEAREPKHSEQIIGEGNPLQLSGAGAGDRVAEDGSEKVSILLQKDGDVDGQLGSSGASNGVHSNEGQGATSEYRTQDDTRFAKESGEVGGSIEGHAGSQRGLQENSEGNEGDGAGNPGSGDSLPESSAKEGLSRPGSDQGVPSGVRGSITEPEASDERNDLGGSQGACGDERGAGDSEVTKALALAKKSKWQFNVDTGFSKYVEVKDKDGLPTEKFMGRENILLVKYFHYAHHFRYILKMRRFMVYEAGFYTQWEDDAVKGFAQDMFHTPPCEKDLELREFLAKAKSLRGFQVVADEFYSGKTTRGLINCKDFTFDISTKKKLTHSPDRFFTYKLDYNYSQDFPRPTWHQIMKNLTGDNQPQIDFIEEFIGYCLANGDYLYKHILVLKGDGDNGKGSLINIIYEILGNKRGSENYSNVDIDSFTKSESFFIAELEGKLANISDDQARESFTKKSVTKLKQLSGNSSTPVQHKGEKPFLLNNCAKLIISVNDTPDIAEINDAIDTRFVIIPFNRNFRKKDKHLFIPDMHKKLVEERPGIMAQCVDAYRAVLARGFFTIPQETADELSKMREFNCPVEQWWADRVTFADETFHISSGDAYQNFVDSYVNERAVSLNQDSFVKRFAKKCRNLNIPQKRVTVNGVQMRVWITLKVAGIQK